MADAAREGRRSGLVRGPAIPLPPLDKLHVQLQIALMYIRALPRARRNVVSQGMHRFIATIEIDGEHLDPVIILFFLKKLKLLKFVKGSRKDWQICPGAVGPNALQALIDAGDVPHVWLDPMLEALKNTPQPQPSDDEDEAD